MPGRRLPALRWFGPGATAARQPTTAPLLCLLRLPTPPRRGSALALPSRSSRTSSALPRSSSKNQLRRLHGDFRYASHALCGHCAALTTPAAQSKVGFPPPAAFFPLQRLQIRRKLPEPPSLSGTLCAALSPGSSRPAAPLFDPALALRAGTRVSRTARRKAFGRSRILVKKM